MNIEIIAALIGFAGSITAAILPARLAPQPAAPTARRRRPPVSPPGARPSTPVPRIGLGALLLVALAWFLFCMGFALFGYAALDFITSTLQAMGSPTPGPPEMSGSLFGRYTSLGFGLMFAGFVVLGIFMLVVGASQARSRK